MKHFPFNRDSSSGKTGSLEGVAATITLVLPSSSSGEWQAVNQLGQSIIQDLERFEIALSCNSKLCELGHGTNVLGSPLKAVLHLISVLSNHSLSMPIQAGEIVTTGTLTSAFAINAGQVWSACLNGMSLPELNIHFET